MMEERECIYMKVKTFVVFLLTILMLAACGAESTPTKNKVETENIKELVNDYSVGNIKNESASITPNQLIVTKSDKSELVYDLGNEDFFVSIAPYENETHPCTYHSLTGCQGEMVEEEFNVYIEDSEGNVIIDEPMKTQANGFIDLWLPRDQTYETRIEHNGKVVESELSTFEDAPTCITTMRLI